MCIRDRPCSRGFAARSRPARHTSGPRAATGNTNPSRRKIMPKSGDKKKGTDKNKPKKSIKEKQEQKKQKKQ